MAAIAVLTNGFVFVVSEVTRNEDTMTFGKARCIRNWGTTNGLAQLVTGPTKDTVLDAPVPVLCAPRYSLVFWFEVSSAWEKHL